MNKQFKFLLISIMTCSFFLASGCYPLSTGSIKWRIKFDKKKQKYKRLYLQNSIPAVSDNQPNIILILADDLGKYDVSLYGAEHIHTPHIDELGREGVTFKDAYVSAPVCAPSRAGILTGRYQQRYGFETQPMEFYPTNLIEYLSGKYFVATDEFKLATKPRYPREWQIQKQGLPPTEFTLAELLKINHYKTAIVGKWHLGYHNPHHVPNKRGFDYQYGFYGAHSLYTPSQNTAGYVNHIQDLFTTKHQWELGRRDHGAIRENNKVVTEDNYLTFAIKDKAIQFMETHKDQPFFLYVPFSAPHVPFQAPVDYYCLYSHIEDENKRVYYAMISALDDAIGEIHKAVKDLGIEDNTIIYFLSDNGGAAYTGATDNGPLKGGKLNYFEGGLNVPFVMKWKGKIPAGTVYEKPVSALDIFTTSAVAGGIHLPDDRLFDGVDLMPFVTGKNPGAPHESLFWRADHIKALRQGDWKIITSTRDNWTHLYKLDEDESEANDVEAIHPELFDQLYEQHQNWQLELPDKPLWPRIMDKRFVIDGVEYFFPA